MIIIIITIIIIIIVYSQCLCLSAPSRVGPMFSFGRRSELAHSESRSINDDFKMFQGYKNYIETIQTSDWFNVNNSSTEAHSKYCTNKIPAEYRFI